MFKAKVLVLGPCQSGKTVISNFLADATETSGGDYHPTQGARILEFEVNNINIGSGRNVNAEVELWDVSGDSKFEACWPAISRGTNGIVFVFNPDQPNHDKELEAWLKYFKTATRLSPGQCLTLEHHKPDTTGKVQVRMPTQFSKIPCIQTNLEDGSETLRTEFNSFLAGLLTALSEKRDQEELSIMNSR